MLLCDLEMRTPFQHLNSWRNSLLHGYSLTAVMLFCSTHFSSVQFSCSVVSDSLRPHEPQQARPPCPSSTPGVHPNPCQIPILYSSGKLLLHLKVRTTQCPCSSHSGNHPQILGRKTTLKEQSNY